MPPPKYKNLIRLGFGLIFGIFLLLTSCIEEPESPELRELEVTEISQVRDWFESNKTNLRLPERGSNYRSESQELILPFFEKEPDWDQFHHYYFPDGREVFEVSLENATKYYPKTLLDSFPNQNPAELMIQNIMFVRHPTLDRFDPLIARYYPDNLNSIEKFNNISFSGLPFDWSGTLDIWTYDEHYLIGYKIDQGQITHTREMQVSAVNGKKGSFGPENMDEAIHCYVVATDWYDGNTGEYLGTTHAHTCEWQRGGSQGGSGSGGGDDYQRPPCCDDPIPVPPRDEPTYDPPSIPAPSTIINQLTNPCAADIFLELSKGNAYLTDITGLGSLDIFPGMLDLFEQSGQFDYRIQNGNTGSEAGGSTSPIVNGIITITLSNDYLLKATSLSIARTIIHETVHAYLRKQTSYRSATDMNTHQLLVEYGRKYPGIINDAHHSLMSQFILGMAVSLYNWDKKYGPTGGSLGFDYYYKMAFGGLVKNGTRELILEAKPYLPDGVSWDEIRKILENEATGNYQANGEKCD
ncbi:hypothetical protein [Algoriphagus algorifonticola]|uniref:hypothetical protein n=1 Tax=Algoriphagus algorifonticola TaxID=2593007 RepID=UPI0011A14AFE|nr:hypothetical protein [Algoriphagus algorifonticola]